MDDYYENVTLAVARDAATPPVLLRSTIPRRLPPNHVLLRVAHFGFSTNNVSYQALGSEPHFRYFDFHAAPPGAHADTHAVVPVWGFATVVAASAPDIAPGERVFGFLAPARYLLLPVDPAATNAFHVYVPRPHLPPDRRPYNQLTRCARDELYAAADEPLAALFRPLFWTAFWAADWLRELAHQHQQQQHYTVLVSSASARTAFCLAFCLGLPAASTNGRAAAPRVVGLTSARNRAAVVRLGLYDAVHAYDDVEAALAQADDAASGRDGGDRVVYVDVAGDAALNRRVWAALGGRAVRSVSLGLTTLAPAAAAAGAYVLPPSAVAQQQGQQGPGQQPSSLSFFFMPEHLARRRGELGARGVAALQREAWAAFAQWGVGGARVERVWGAETVRDAWRRALDGGGGSGGVWSMWGDGEEEAEEEEEETRQAVEKARL